DKKEYLTDDAGNRRYWPVPMGALDFEGVERDRDQLFAEAKWTYDNLPEPLWLEGEAKAQAVELQSQHMIDSESDDMPTRFRIWVENSDQVDGISLYSLFDEGPFIHYPKNTTTLMKAALVLRNFGYRK